IKNQKSKIKNQKSKIKNQKSKIKQFNEHRAGMAGALNSIGSASVPQAWVPPLAWVWRFISIHACIHRRPWS
ncbi:PE/PPE C-terminal domain-containing protein, partial [Roseiflexus sp.]